MPGNRPIGVLIVDDSASVRQAMAAVIGEAPDLEVIGAARDPVQAAEAIRRRVPDVITLDVEMPRMDGITFLRRLMAQRPVPVIVCSSLVGAGTRTLMDALEAGAVDVVQKPQLGTRAFFEESALRIQDAVRAAARARLGPARQARPEPREPEPPRRAAPAAGALAKTTQCVIAVGASTGGTEALRRLVEAMPPYAPPILIVQHMPERFTRAFAERLDTLAPISVAEAEDGMSVLRGRALIAPGNRHMTLRRSGASYYVAVADGPLVNRHRPSADVLFDSVARVAGGNAIGAILTGMGADGARGLKAMREAGALTIGQDEASCVVYGMPREALKIGAVARELPLEEIAPFLLREGREAV
jgi:two-component system chemotaxis response regulator CheB